MRYAKKESVGDNYGNCGERPRAEMLRQEFVPFRGAVLEKGTESTP